jgi:hypothetical protein
MTVLASFARVYVCDIDEDITIFQHSPKSSRAFASRTPRALS